MFFNKNIHLQDWIISLIGFTAQLWKKLVWGTEQVRVRQENETSLATRKTNINLYSKKKKQQGVRGLSALTQRTAAIRTDLPLTQALEAAQRSLFI